MSEEKQIHKEKEQTPKDQEEPKEEKASEEKEQKTGNPVVRTMQVVLLLAAIVFVWYVFSDRMTPYTSQSRVKEIIIPVTPRVSGYLIDVRVKLNSVVKANDLLFQIDTTSYALAVRKAIANLENVIQQLGAQSASVKAAASAVGVAKAQLDRAQRNYNRVERIVKKNPGALSQYDIDRVETSLSQAVEKLSNAEANLAKAKKQLGPTGENNPQLRMAINDLDNAQMQLNWTKVYAPADGYIESFNLDVGYYCQAGKPITTLVSKEDLWIQADFKENNLSNLKQGDDVEFILDIAPGKVCKGKVRSIGYGVDDGTKVTPGNLPKISSKSSWLQDPQRFPVIVSVTDTTARRLCRAGGQADVVVYTGKHPLLNAIAKLRIRINTWLSYVR
jgi:multidrug resistance efflux pump